MNLGRQWTLVSSCKSTLSYCGISEAIALELCCVIADEFTQRFFSHWSSHRRISSSSTISAASNDLSRDYSSDTQDEELQREDLSTRTLISQGAQPVSVITQGRLPPPLPSYRLLHNDLPSSVSTMVDESLFTSLCEFD